MTLRTFVGLSCGLVFITGLSSAQTGHVFYIDNSLETGSIPEQPVHEFAQPEKIAPEADNVGEIKVDLTKKYQTMVGVGAAFSEIGTLAFLTLDKDQQNKVLTNLFNPKEGAGFQMCRLPVGSSDFGVSAYSFDDKPGDYDMSAFSLARDEKSIIPVVQAALKQNPTLMLFASPWSPPGWMKPTGTMDKGGKENHLIDDDKIYKAYALYFQKYLQGYLADGIMINRLCPQNEMDANPGYPGCMMPPETMTKFVVNYLAPQFKQAGIKTEIWPGTFREKPATPWAETCLQNEDFRKVSVGLGIQYCNGTSIKHIADLYPNLKFMFTEANCNGGKNKAKEAQSRMNEMLNAFRMGCDAYAYWNMMLDEKQSSGWGWHQNSLVTFDRTAHTIQYNADYQPLFLVSKYLRPGDVRVDDHNEYTKKGIPVHMTFLKPDGTILVLAQNMEPTDVACSVVSDGKTVSVMLPGHSDCAILVK